MQWVCKICGFVTDDEELPGSCPVCGAPSDKFSEWVEEDLDYPDETDSDQDFENDLFGDYEE